MIIDFDGIDCCGWMDGGGWRVRMAGGIYRGIRTNPKSYFPPYSMHHLNSVLASSVVELSY